MNSVAESSGRPRGKPRGKHWSVGTDVHLLSLMHRRQLKLYAAEQRAIEARLKQRRTTDATFEMTERDASKLASINVFMRTATQSMLDLNDRRDQLRASEQTDVLVAQLRHEFTLAARSFTDDELKILGRNLHPEAFAVLDRVRCDRFGAGQWIPMEAA